MTTTATGVVGCAFFAFGKWQTNQQLIHVQLAASWDDGATFSQLVTVTDQPWDPLVDAPFSHGDSAVHFIGEHFGLDAGDEDFALLWTDPRTANPSTPRTRTCCGRCSSSSARRPPTAQDRAAFARPASGLRQADADHRVGVGDPDPRPPPAVGRERVVVAFLAR